MRDHSDSGSTLDSSCGIATWLHVVPENETTLVELECKAMSTAETYQVVWPRGRQFKKGARLAKRLDSLEGKVVAQLWDWVFKGDKMYDVWERELTKRYPGIKFISWREFGEIHGANEHKVLEELPTKLKQYGVDAVICGVGC
jgi:hypothetical protein